MVDFVCQFSDIGDDIQKVQRHNDLIKAHTLRDNVYQAACNATVNMNGNW